MPVPTADVKPVDPHFAVRQQNMGHDRRIH